MMDPAVATYGEENRLWTGDEARAFAASPPFRRSSPRARGTRARKLDWRRDGTHDQGPPGPYRLVDAESPARARGHRRRPDRGRRGYALAVRLLTDKSTYNTVEDVTGRMMALRSGDVLAGVLGIRRALRGYAGDVPSHIAVGDTIEVLNLGGILGRCTSENPDIGPPFQAEVLGSILTSPSSATASDALRTSGRTPLRPRTCSSAGSRWSTSRAPA